MACSQTVRLIGFLLGISLLFSSAKANFNKLHPTMNINFPPFIKVLSAYYCLKNISSVCPPSYTLTQSGWLNVSAADTEVFCQQGGCADHTLAVLTCVKYVDKEFQFQNNASVWDLKQTISTGCSQGFTGISLHSSSEKSTISALVTLLSLAFVALFYM